MPQRRRVSSILQVMRLTRSLLVTLTFVAGSTLNPAYISGCGSDEPGFEYDAADMEALLQRVQGTFAVAASDVNECSADWSCARGASDYRIELELAPEAASSGSAATALRGWLGARAHACGNRRLFASAGACFDYSTMPVRGTLKLIRLDAEREVVVADEDITQGELEVPGLKLSYASLRLSFSGGEVTFAAADGQQFGAPTLRLTPR
jgi:hypothetical protein